MLEDKTLIEKVKAHECDLREIAKEIGVHRNTLLQCVEYGEPISNRVKDKLARFLGMHEEAKAFRRQNRIEREIRKQKEKDKLNIEILQEQWRKEEEAKLRKKKPWLFDVPQKVEPSDYYKYLWKSYTFKCKEVPQ